MTLFEELTWRGFVQQVTHEDLPEALEKERFTFYGGFDPTADSLHIGSLLPIMGMAHLQRAGHRPIALVGGGTGLIGDPSGKASERTLLTKEAAERNVAGIRGQLEHFLEFSGDHAALMVNNADWLCQLNLLDFLRDFGKHFSVNVMLSRESVRQRLADREHGISYTEFSYSLLQAYDFFQLAELHGCRLQVGGSDQWGNIVAGMDLTRRLLGKATYGMTFPLVTKADGAKFGKSESGNIWLDPARTSPYKFYQFWINQADADTPRWLRFFTFLPQEEIAACEQQIVEAPHERAAQKRLAEEVTRLVHGEEALNTAKQASEALFGGDLRGLDSATLRDVFNEAPNSALPQTTLEKDLPVLDLLVQEGVFSSKGDARRLVKSGGLYINNERVTQDDLRLSAALCLSENLMVIRKGKRNYHLLQFV